MSRVQATAAILLALALTLGAGPAGYAAGPALAQQAAPEAEPRNLATAVAEVMTDLRMVLGSISNEASAEAAGPPLQDLRVRLEALAPRIGSLGAEDRAELVEIINREMPSVRSLAERITNLGGSEALRPVLDPIVARLEGWAS